MDSSRDLARALGLQLEQTSMLCSESLRVVKQHEGLGELNAYARLVGRFMGHCYANLMAPMWERFPEFGPTQMFDLDPGSSHPPMLSPPSQAAIAAFLAAAAPALELAERFAASATGQHFGGVPEVRDAVDAIEQFLSDPVARPSVLADG